MENIQHFCRVPRASKQSHIGKIYIVTESDRIKTEVESFIGGSSVGMFYLPYSIVCISDCDQLSDIELAKVAKSLGANVFVQVLSPDNDCPVFLFEESDGDSLGTTAINIIYEAEKLGKESVRSAIINFALNNPEECNEWLQADEAEPIATMDDVCYEMHHSNELFGSLYKGIIQSSPNVTSRQLEMMSEFSEARRNFIKHVQELKNGEPEISKDAEKKVDWVLKGLTDKQKNKIVKLYLKELDNEDVEGFYSSFIDKEAIPLRSKIKLFIEKSSDCINNDGYYRLSYQFADFEKRPLHFKHKSACIVYLMLLICRKKDKNMNSFFTFEKENIEDRNLFVKLMTSVYDKNDAEAHLDYNNLFTDEFGAQGRLKDYIKSCKDLFDDEVMDYESPYTFIPQKIGSSGRDYVLPILPQNITFDENFPLD